jgi:hypothetical protein
LSVYGSRSANSICSLASWRRRSLILGVLIGSPSEGEEAPEGIFVDERDRSERASFLIASCPSFVCYGEINISWSVGSSDRDTVESAVAHVARGGMVDRGLPSHPSAGMADH